MEGEGLEPEDIRVEDKESPPPLPPNRPNQSIWSKLSRSLSARFNPFYSKRQTSNVTTRESSPQKETKMAAALEKQGIFLLHINAHTDKYIYVLFVFCFCFFFWIAF